MLDIYTARIWEVSGICSGCGKMPHEGCAAGIIDSEDTAHGFCNNDCLLRWLVNNGFGPIKLQVALHKPDIDIEKLPMPSQIRCPACGSENHYSKLTAFFAGYFKYIFDCQNCGRRFRAMTR